MSNQPPIIPDAYPTVGNRKADDTFDVTGGGGNIIANVGPNADGLVDYIAQWQWYNRNIKAADAILRLLKEALDELKAGDHNLTHFKDELKELDPKCNFNLSFL